MLLRPRPLLLLLALLASAGPRAQDAAPDALPPDGPYLLYDHGELVAYWVDTDRRSFSQAALGEPLPDFPTFRPELIDPRRDFGQPTSGNYQNISRVAAMSDIHGQFDVAATLLRRQGIVDDSLHWAWGDGHLVIVGDIFDRGPRVTETLWLIHNLEIEAARAGGRVHFLLGNHETMILEGDDRYVNSRYRTTCGLLRRRYRELYGAQSYLGRWLRSHPLLVRINGNVYVHGGLSREMVRQVDDITQLNDIYHRYLIDEDTRVARQKSSRLDLLYGREGPLWYRGYFSRDAVSQRDIEYILGRIGAERIVVGHTSFQAIQSFYRGRVLAVDSSMKFGSLGELLLIENGKLYRGLLDGRRKRLLDSVAR